MIVKAIEPNSPYEKHFVRSFVRKDRRERLLYELSKPEKRYNGISRFCHHAGELLDDEKTVMSGEDLDRRPEFMRFINEHDELCIVLSPDPGMDGRTLSAGDAVAQAVMCLDAAVIIGSTFAVVFGEPVKGGRDKYLLSVLS